MATGRERGIFRGHEASVLSLAFSADGKHLITGSGDATVLIWDLATVAERTTAQLGKQPAIKESLEPKELEAAWADLAEEDAVKAQKAIWSLVVASKQAAPFLREHVRPAKAPNDKQLAALIADLDSSDFQTRQKATTAMAGMVELAHAPLRKNLEGNSPRRCAGGSDSFWTGWHCHQPTTCVVCVRLRLWSLWARRRHGKC